MTAPRWELQVVTPTVDAEAGKRLAVWLFCIGARSLHETIIVFQRHPEWRSA